MAPEALLKQIRDDPDLFLGVRYAPVQADDPCGRWMHFVDIVEVKAGGRRIVPIDSRPSPRSYGALLRLIENRGVLSVGVFDGYGGELYKNV